MNFDLMKDVGTSVSIAPSVATIRPTKSTQKFHFKELSAVQVYRKLDRAVKSKASIGTTIVTNLVDAELDCELDGIEA